MKYFLIIALAFFLADSSMAGTLPQADRIMVIKSKRTLCLIKGGKTFRCYKIALGDNPLGHKQQVGDCRTPEGRYIVDWRKNSYRHYKALHISYPNTKDIRSAKERGVKPGGMIMIHGLPTTFDWSGRGIQDVDWTNGCIAVTNSEIDEIFKCVKDGTPIEILP